jgi:MFS transporter, DHA2 family, multidrug resistance protein
MSQVKARPRAWLALAVLCLPTMLAVVDLNVLFLALPQLSADLNAGGSAQLWIMDVYGFMIAGFLVTMGGLGDRIGYRKVLLAGAAVFVVASIVGAHADSVAVLIGARALLGVAGATVMPSVLALIRNLFTDPRQLGAAYGIWGTSIMVGVVVGPSIGGLLLGAFWWGAALLIGVPVMGLLLVAGPFLLPESPGGGGGRLDPLSVVLSLAAILPFVYGLKEIARGGADLPVAAAIVAGPVFGALFVTRQRRLDNPLLDLRLFANREVRGGLSLAFVLAFSMAGVGLLVTQYLQVVKGLSPLAVGLWMLPPSLAMIAAGNVGPALARTVRPAYIFAAGLVLATAGAADHPDRAGRGGRLAGCRTVRAVRRQQPDRRHDEYHHHGLGPTGEGRLGGVADVDQWRTRAGAGRGGVRVDCHRRVPGRGGGARRCAFRPGRDRR